MASLRIARAEPNREHLEVILRLIEDARSWLWTKRTSMWETPWPDRERRDARVLAGLGRGKTWIVWAEDLAVATVTISTRANPDIWKGPACTCDLSERAVYVHRLITARRFAGWGLGAELIDWAGLRGQNAYGAKWIRIDVWSSNRALHEYYLSKGFMRCGSCSDPNYSPSGALFQKRVPDIVIPVSPLFTESEDAHYGDSCHPPRGMAAVR